MTLAQLPRIAEYDADGVSTVFTIPWQFFDATDVDAWLRDGDGVETPVDPVNFAVTGGAGATGTLTFTTAPVTGLIVVMRGDTPIKHDTAYPDGGKFPAATVERDFDRLTAMLQESADRVRDIFSRAMLAPPGETLALLPPADVRKGTLQAWDAETGLTPVNTVNYAELYAAYQATLIASAQAVQAAQQAMAIVAGDEAIETITGAITVGLADTHKHIRANASADLIISLDNNLPIGAWAKIERMGPSPVYVLGSVGVTVHSKGGNNKLDPQYGVGRILKVANNEWLLSGDLNGIYTPAPPTPVAVPYFDSFLAPTGTLNGRSMELGGLTWSTTFYLGTNANALTVATAGFLSGLQGTSPNQSFGGFTVPNSNRQWVRRRGLVADYIGTTASTGVMMADQLTVGGALISTSWMGLCRTSGAAGVPASLGLTAIINGVSAGNITLGTSITLLDNDTIDSERNVSGSNITYTNFLNGRQLGGVLDVTAAFPTLPISNRFGFRGNIPSLGGNDIMVGDPTTKGMIRQYAPNRVRQREIDGSVNPVVFGTVTVQDPLAMKVQIEDATGSVLSAWTPLLSYAGVGLSFSGLAPQISSPPSGGYVIRIRREDGVSGATIEGNVSRLTVAGEVIWWGGQSLAANGLFAVAGGTLTAATDHWFIHGTIGQGAGQTTYINPYDRRQLKVVDLSPLATFGRVITDNTSPVPICSIIGTRGGTNSQQRLPGTDNHAAVLDGVLHAGNDVRTGVYIGGHFEAVTDTTMIPNYVANVRAERASVSAQTGKPLKLLFVPIGCIWGATDVNSETLRKNIWQACQDYPDEFYPGPYLMHLQHLAADIYHLKPEDYDEEFRLCGFEWLMMGGELLHGRAGPKLHHVTKDSSSQCTVYVDPDGATSLSLLNAAYVGPAGNDYRGGLRFGTDGTFASELMPLSCAIGALSGGLYPCTYTFAGTPFAALGVFVSGPYGTEPFNRTFDPTIRQDYGNRASMLVGNRAGERSVPIRPYYQSGGAGDYIHS